MLKLRPDQEEGIAWLAERPRALLADEAGLGKTVQLLKTAVEPVLIVAPAMVLESETWNDEIEKWAPGIENTQIAYTSICQRGARGRIARDQNGFPLVPLKPEYGNPTWGSVILDEAHYCKGRKTSWAVAIEKLKAEQVHQATGNPIENWADEAFMLLRSLWPDEARAGHEYGSYWRWINKWFHVGIGYHGGREIGDLCTADHIVTCADCVGRAPRTWDEFVSENWADRMLQRLRKDVLELPPLTMQDWHTPMTREQKRVYKELRRDYITQLTDDTTVEVWSEPGALVKLAQIASGLETVDPTVAPGSTGKFKALLTILSDRPRPTLVVGHFRSTMNVAGQVAERAGKTVGVVHGGIQSAQRKAAIRAFQRGELDVLCASIGTISEGMTLHQGGADQVIRMERAWTPTKNDQVLRRLHREGLERPIHCIDLITPDSMDERVLSLLASKSDQQMKALRGDVLKTIV